MDVIVIAKRTDTRPALVLLAAAANTSRRFHPAPDWDEVEGHSRSNLMQRGSHRVTTPVIILVSFWRQTTTDEQSYVQARIIEMMAIAILSISCTLPIVFISVSLYSKTTCTATMQKHHRFYIHLLLLPLK